MYKIYSYIDKISNINSEIINSCVNISFTNIKLENLYKSSFYLENRKIIKNSLLFLIILYFIVTILGLVYEKPRLYIFFTINSILNIFLLFTYLRVKKMFIVRIVLSAIYFTIILFFNFLHFIVIYEDFGEFRTRITYFLIFIRNFLYVVVYNTNLPVFIFSNLFSVIRIFISAIIHENNNLYYISDIFVEVIISCVTFVLKKYYEIISRQKFSDLIKLNKLNEYFLCKIDHMNDFNFSIFENKIIYINKNLKNFLDIKYFKKKIFEIKKISNQNFLSELNTLYSDNIKLSNVFNGKFIL